LKGNRDRLLLGKSSLQGISRRKEGCFGKGVNWGIETLATARTDESGWSPKTLHRGDQIRSPGTQAKGHTVGMHPQICVAQRKRVDGGSSAAANYASNNELSQNRLTKCAVISGSCAAKKKKNIEAGLKAETWSREGSLKMRN